MLGTFAIVAGDAYFAVTRWARWSAEYGPELAIDTQAREQEAETELKQATDEYSRWLALGNAVQWKSAQPNNSDAQTLATELLGTTQTYKPDWNSGNAIHNANSALGTIALRSEDKAAARKYLLASANSSVCRGPFVTVLILPVASGRPLAQARLKTHRLRSGSLETALEWAWNVPKRSWR